MTVTRYTEAQLLERIAVALERQANHADKILGHWAAQHEREDKLMSWREKDRAAALARAERDDEFVAEQRALLALQRDFALDVISRAADRTEQP